MSIRRPHRHVWNDGGNGSRRRRNITTSEEERRSPLSGSASELVTNPIQLLGQPMTSPALSLGRKRSNTFLSVLVLPPWTKPHVANLCHLLAPNASGSSGEGRVPSIKACHVGGSNPQTPVSDIVALASAPNAPSGAPSNAQMQSQHQGASGKSLAWNLPSSPSTQKW